MRSSPGFDTRTDNAEWLQALRSDGQTRDQALADLRRLIVRGLEAALRPRVDRQVEAMAQDVTQEALMRVLDRLDSFRGESRFTTWAQKVAVRMALTKLRRKRWENVQMSDLPDGDAGVQGRMKTQEKPPDQQTELTMAVDLVRHSIQEDLTSRQRTVMQAVVMKGMPLSEVADHMGSTRNALYKLMHDARKRLKQKLKRRGVDPTALLETLES